MKVTVLKIQCSDCMNSFNSVKRGPWKKCLHHGERNMKNSKSQLNKLIKIKGSKNFLLALKSRSIIQSSFDIYFTKKVLTKN